MSAESEKFWVELHTIGPERVRANLANGVYVGEWASLAKAWLERRVAASQTEQLSLSRGAATQAGLASARAHNANKIAIAAIIIAIVSLIVTVISVLHKP
jgi:hypothetical protein